MNPRFRVLPLMLAGLAASPATSSAQGTAEQQVTAEHLFAPGVVSISVFGGAVAFSDFRREADPIGTDMPLERRISARTSLAASAAVSYWFNSRVGARLYAGFAPSRFVERSLETYQVAPLAAGEEPRLSRVDVWMADADLLVRLPFSFGRVEPYAIIGAGAIDYRLRTADDETVPPEVEMAFDGRSERQLAGVLGIGAVVPLERHGLLLNFELGNHISRTPLYQKNTPEQLLADPESGERIDEVGYTMNLRLMLGLTIPLSR